MPTSEAGWVAACPSQSLLWKFGVNYDVPTDKSFISSHSATMDLCNQPSLFTLHGSLISITPGTQSELMPHFSLSKTHLHADILGVPVEHWADIGQDDDVTGWEDKTDGRLLWRGQNTGGWFSKETEWRRTHRARLVRMARGDLEEEVEVLPSPGRTAQTEDYGNKTLEEMISVWSQAELNAMMLDVGLAYHPIRTCIHVCFCACSMCVCCVCVCVVCVCV